MKRKVKRRHPVKTTPNEVTLDGSRIVNLQMLQDHVQDVTNHVVACHPSVNKQSTKHNIVMKEQSREGLSSVLTSHCTSCNTDFYLMTSRKVWGQMSTSGGHPTVTETIAVCGIPTMTKKIIHGC